jgi:hypothetical protein
VNSLAVNSSGKMMSVGRPPGLFVRCATEARREWHLYPGSSEDRCDLIERELWRNVSVVWATIFEDAIQSRENRSIYRH